MDDDTRLREGPVARGDEGQRPRSGDGQGPRSGEGQVARSGLQGPIATAQAAGTGVYAALDLGTDNCRLLIACRTVDGFRAVDSFSRSIRQGQGSSATGCISDAAIGRAIAALSIRRDKLHYRRAKGL